MRLCFWSRNDVLIACLEIKKEQQHTRQQQPKTTPRQTRRDRQGETDKARQTRRRQSDTTRARPSASQAQAKKRVNEHPRTTTEASDCSRPPRSAAASGRLFLPAAARRLWL